MASWIKFAACFSFMLFILGFIGCVITSPIISNYNKYIHEYDNLPYCHVLNTTKLYYSCSIYENCFCNKVPNLPKCDGKTNYTCTTDHKCTIHTSDYNIVCDQQIGYYCYLVNYVIINSYFEEFNISIDCEYNILCIDNLPNQLDKCGYINGLFYYTNPNTPQIITESTAIGLFIGSFLLLLCSIGMIIYFAGCKQCGKYNSIV